MTQEKPDRIDRIEGKVDQILGCLHGNGREGLVSRVARLEEVRAIGSKGFWALVAFVSAIVSGSILAGGSALLAWLKG